MHLVTFTSKLPDGTGGNQDTRIEKSVSILLCRFNT